MRDLLGHASIITTERYDNQKLEALQAAVERLERGKDTSLNAKSPSNDPLQVTDSGHVDWMVPLRGFEPRSRG
ncbi:MAG: hypothetical protein ABJC89_19160 [Acidobacteriota bacterium]